jgi:tetratricopeptide (TPR) repeat protein
MSTAARIEELLGKFGENPRRYFAPLANEYRKAGDLAQAIALCREHLPKQPGHMSGHIVFGQALFENGDIDEAQQVFEAALALDPENLIALRHLGDIARQRGDALSARRWYGRVLDADPRNDDIAALIESLQFRATPAAPVAAIPSDVASPAPVDAASTSYIDEPAWHTPSFLEHSGGVEPAAFDVPTPVAVEPPAVELLDLDLPVDVPTADETIVAAAEGLSTDVMDEVRAFDAFGAEPTIEVIDAEQVIEAIDGEQAIEVIDAEQVIEAIDGEQAIEVIDAEPTTGVIDAALDAFAAHDPLDDGDRFAIDATAEAWTTASVSDATQPVDIEQPTVSTLSSELADVDVDATLAFEEGLLAEEWPSTDTFATRATTPVSAVELVAEPIEAVEDVIEAAAEPVEAVEAVEASFEAALPPVEPIVALEAMIDEPALIEVADESVASWEAATQTSEVDAIADFDFDEIESAGADQVAAEQVADAVVADDLGEAVERAISDDLPYTIEEDSLTEPAFFGATDEDPPVSAAEMSWLSIAEEEQEEVALSDTSLFAESEVEGAPVWASGAHDTVRDDDTVVLSAEDLVAEEIPSDDAVVEPAASPAFVTETMAELLVAQGFVPRAIEVYEELVRRRPYDVALVGRLAELQATVNTPTPRYATPISATPISTTPLSATPISVTPLGVSAVSPTPRAMPLVAPAPRRTAREWFGELAARRVSRRTPRSVPAVPTVATLAADAAASATASEPHAVHYDTPADGLASLFGNASLTGIDDVQAAQSLASAFGSAATTSEGGDLFDDMAAMAESSDADRGYEAPAPAAFEAASSGTESESESFSFDRFFPDPARVAEPSPDAAAQAPADGAVSPTQELAQFATWLKGLSNS